MLYVGVSGVLKGGAAGEPLGMSGMMIAIVSVFGILQGAIYEEKPFSVPEG